MSENKKQYEYEGLAAALQKKPKISDDAEDKNKE